MHFLPFPQSLGPRGKLDRYKPSHKEQFEEGKYSPRRLGEELTHTSSLLPLQKKKAIWGSLSHQKRFPSDLRKRLKISSLGRGYWETQSSSTLEPPIDFISTAMAKLGPFSWQPALSRTGDGEIQGEESGGHPRPRGPPQGSLSPRVGCAGQNTPSPDCPPAVGLQRGMGVSLGQGESRALTHGESWTTRGGVPRWWG